MTKTNKELCTDIFIAGGGTPGLTLAILLGRLGANIIVVDKYPPPALKDIQPDGRTSALMDGSVNILKATNAWDKALPHGEILQTLRIIDDSLPLTDPVQADFKSQEIGLDAFGVNMPNNVLRAALGDEVKKLKSVTIISAALQDFETDDFGITAYLDDGTKIRAKLLVGADGRYSKTRDIAGITCKEKDYGQQAITCLMSHEKPHNNISTEFHRPSGPFTMVPLPGHCSSLVWVDFDDKIETLTAMDEDIFLQTLQDKSKDLLGTITLRTNPQAWPLKSLKAKNLTAKRVALVAEAAHVIHPLGAQGLNLSLRDVATLAEILADAMRSGQDPGSKVVLDQYERRRRRDIASRVIGTDKFNRMVSNDSKILRHIRRTGLKTIANITPLKELMMQQGLTPSLDKSRLSAGKQL